MADVPTFSPEVSRSVAAFARSLLAAARAWALYPPDHPATGGALERLRAAIADACSGSTFSVGVTPDSLLVAGGDAPGPDTGAIADTARWLHDRDILRLTFTAAVDGAGLQRLLGLFSEDAGLVRQRGGPAAVWVQAGHPAVLIEQIDFSQVLRDGNGTGAVRRKDDVWRSIVRGVLDRRQPDDDAVQARLLAIAGDTIAIGELAADVIAPHHAADGSPMLTSQAAAVVAAYHRLVDIVGILSPDERRAVMQRIAAATATLEPPLVVHVLGGNAIAGDGGRHDGGRQAVVAGIVEAMDDARIAQLLATTLALEGQASPRIAAVFNTIATDDERRSRVLALTRQLLSASDFGSRGGFDSLWSSMEALLLAYDERPFVSGQYGAGLDGVGARAASMAARVPADLADLIATLDQDNIRRLSVALLVDLLKLERDPARAPELAGDVAALAEDLLLAGDYESALTVVAALQTQAADARTVTYAASRAALDALVSTPTFREAAALLGDMTEAEADRFADICARVGPAAIETLSDHLEEEAMTPARTRASAIVRRYGHPAAGWLTPLVNSPHWPARRNAAQLLGEIGSAASVPLLQTLLRGGEPRVTHAAVRALAQIDDPAAGRAVHTALRAATGDQRRAVVDALVAQRDARVVPVLVRILDESDPFGADHAIVLDTLDAVASVGRLGDDQAVTAVAGLMRKKKLLARRRVHAVRLKSLAALRAINSPGAARALDDAARHGDRMLRRMARAAG